jgi:regulator of cell morphogenesis and NO signaling
MDGETIAKALEREHHEIDERIEAFTAGLARGETEVGRLVAAMDALRRHIYLEEEFLFPPLREAGLVAPIFVMLREHGEIWTTLDALEAKLRKGSGGDLDGSGGDGDVAALCAELLGQLERHNSKEEPIIYPQADAVLDAHASAELSAFVDSGAMPEGWVCQRA